MASSYFGNVYVLSDLRLVTPTVVPDYNEDIGDWTHTRLTHSETSNIDVAFPTISTQLIGTNTCDVVTNKTLLDPSNLIRATALSVEQGGSVSIIGAQPPIPGYVLTSVTSNTANWKFTPAGILCNVGTGAEVYAGTDTCNLSSLRTFLGTENGLGITQNASDITIDNTLSGINVGLGCNLFVSKVGSNLQFRTLTSGSGITIVENASDINISASGAASLGLSNQDTGAQVYNESTSNGLRTLFGSLDGATVTQNATNIVFNNTLEGENVGTGQSIYLNKVGSNLQFRTLIAGTPNVMLMQNATDITINVSTNESNLFYLTTLSNEGGGIGVWDESTSNTLKSLFGTNNGLVVTSNATSITIDNTLEGQNVGTGCNVYLNKVGSNLQFRTLISGTPNVTLTQNASDITISVTENNSNYLTTLANEGGGVGVWDESTSNTLKSLFGTNNGSVVTSNASSITIDNTLEGQNVGTGCNVYLNKVGSNLQFRTLTAGASIAIVENASDINISVTGSALMYLSNEDTGAQVYDESTSNTMRTLFGSFDGITITQNATNLTFNNTLQGENVGAGCNIYLNKVGSNLQFRTLIAGTPNVTLTENASDITISITDNDSNYLTTLANEGGGIGVWDESTSNTLKSLFGTTNGITVSSNATSITIDNTLTGVNIGVGSGTLFDSKTGSNLQFNSLAGTANGLSVSAPVGGTITIDNTLTGSNVGLGCNIFANKIGSNLVFRTLTSGSNVVLTQNAEDINIAVNISNVPLNLLNEGGGVEVFDDTTTSTFRTFYGTANGATVTQFALSNVIDNTLEGQNVGIGENIYLNKVGSNLQFRTLIAGSPNVVLTQNASDITISVTDSNYLTTLANEGGGIGVWDESTSNILKSLFGTANGISISSNVTSITIDNTLSATNIGAGSGTLFNVKTGSNLQFNSLAGTANGLTVSAPVGGTIIIDNTLTGSNVGLGCNIFVNKIGSNLVFRTLTSGSNVVLTQNAQDINISVNFSDAPLNLLNEGGGVEVFDETTTSTFRTFYGTANGATITQFALSNVIDNTLVGVNVGAGCNVYLNKVGANLQFRTLVAGTPNVVLTENASDISISVTDNDSNYLTTLANEGGGIGIWDESTTNTLKSLFGTANGISISSNATSVTIDNTLVGVNVGTGCNVYLNKVGADLQFRTLIAGTPNVILTQNASDITISVTDNDSNYLTTLANEGGGIGVWDESTSNTLKSLFGTTNGITVSSNATSITINNTLSATNIGAGSGTLFDSKTGSNLQFNSLAGTANGLSVSAPVGGTIIIDNTLTGSNVGLGCNIFVNKIGSNLVFRTLTSGSNVVLTQNAQDINISVNFSDAPLNLLNEGGGVEVFDETTTSTFRTFYGTANGATVTQFALSNVIDNTLVGVNVGTGCNVYLNKVGANLQFRTLIAGTPNVVLTQNASDITISVTDNDSNYLTTLANEGGGIGVWDESTSNTLKTLFGTANGIAVSSNATSITIENTLSATNIGAGSGTLFDSKTGSNLQFNSLTGTASGLSVSAPVGGTITIDNTLIGVNVGTGCNVYLNKVGANLQFRTLIAGTPNVVLTQNASDITISVTDNDSNYLTTLANEGGGIGVWDESTSNTLKSLFGTANGLVISSNATSITIENTLSATNIGAGSGTLFDSKTGSNLQFNSLTGTASGLSVSAPVGGTITIDNTLAGQNVGTGENIYLNKIGSNLQFRTLIAGTPNVVLTQNASDITIDVIDNDSNYLTTLANEGGGIGVWDESTSNTLKSLFGTANGLVISSNATSITIDNTLTATNIGAGSGTLFDSKTGSNLQFNSLAGTANGITVSTPVGGTITIDNTLAGVNVGTGCNVYLNKVGANLQFRTLLAGTANVQLIQNPSDITISVTDNDSNYLTTLANEGGGIGVWDESTSNTLKSLFGATNGISITSNANSITINNILSGSNIGTGAGTIFSTKVGSNLQFNSLTGAVTSGLIAYAPVGGTITLSNTLSGLNIGTGAGTVFSTKSGSNLQFNSLTGAATSGLIAYAPVGGTITLSNTLSGSNIGTGAGTVYSTKVGSNLQFNTLAGAATSGLIVYAPVGGTITLSNTLSGSNIGAGTGTVFSTKVGSNLQFNSLQGTNNGLSVSVPVTGTITVDNTLTGSNVGLGCNLFLNKTGSNLIFRSIFPGSFINIAQNPSDVTVNVNGSASAKVITIATDQLTVTTVTATDVAYYALWDNTRYGEYATRTIAMWVIPSSGTRDLTVDIANNGGAILGTTTIPGGSATGYYSFTFTAPGANTRLDFRIYRSAGTASNPEIYGINMNLT